MWKIKRLFISLLVNTVLISSVYEQYILQDNDVTVTDGIIQNCIYDYNITDIEIPDTINNQAVIGIDNKSYSEEIFRDKGISSIKLPATIKYIGDYAFFSTGLVSLDLSLCKSLESIGKYAFSENSLNYTENKLLFKYNVC